METLGDKLENRLKFHENERVKRIREIRKRNNRKKRIWIGLVATILLVLILVRLDQSGTFDMFFKKTVSYSGNKEYVEINKDEDTVKRDDIVRMAQLLINHPYEFGKQELVLGIPQGPLDSAGFVDWVYFNLTGKALSAKSKDTGPISSKLWDASTPVMEYELQVGDLGFYIVPESSKINPVGIYIGVINGEKAFIHAGGVNYKAEGLEAGRVVVSLNNTLKRNNVDMEGNKFSPSAESTQFVYYRRPKLNISN